MFDHLKNKFPIDNDKWEDYIKNFKRIEVAAKTVLLKEGEISQKAFLIEKGCVRAWFNNDGKDLTFQFFFENSTVASIESFRKKIPSPVTLETIEPSVLWFIHKEDLERIMAEIIEIPELRDQFINIIFERTFNYMKHFFSFIKDSPEQRYLNLIKEQPWIVKRIPQHYIASYLGISTVHLSRIKNKLVKKK
jgi:CRP-like cAMP-binding protein